MKSRSRIARTNVLLPRTLYRELMRALQRRHKLDALAGKESPTTLCGWVREKARETVAACR